MPNGNSRNSLGTGAGRNRRYGRYGSTTDRRPLRCYSQTRGDWRDLGHCRGYRWQYLLTELPRWARKWPGRCLSFWTQDEGAGRAELERIADALEDKLAVVKARLESIEGDDRTNESENDTSAGPEQ
ncbi:MAG: DUF5320 family protein [Halobacteriota archaeon]